MPPRLPTLTFARMASLRRGSLSSGGREGFRGPRGPGGAKHQQDRSCTQTGRAPAPSTSPLLGLKPPPAPPSTAPPQPPGALTAQGRHEILQGFAIERERGARIPLLVLPHRLHHQLGLGRGQRGLGGSVPPHPTAAPPPSPEPAPLTALGKLSGLGACSMSTKGWAKKSWKEMRRRGSLSRRRCRRSRQSGDSGGRLGSWGGG